MYRKSLILLLIAALVAMFAVSCSDDDDNNPTGGGTTQTPQTPAVVENLTNLQESGVTTNLANSQDPNGYGTMAADYIESVEGIKDFLVPPASAARQERPSLALTDTVTYTWSDGSLSMTMLWIETTTEYIWKALLTGDYGGTDVTDFVVVEARQSLTTTSGWMEMYFPGYTGYLLRWEWSETAGVFTMTMTGAGVVDTFEVELVVYADGSGYVEFTDGSEYWQITWNAAGTSGTWTDNTSFGTWSYSG